MSHKLFCIKLLFLILLAWLAVTGIACQNSGHIPDNEFNPEFEVSNKLLNSDSNFWTVVPALYETAYDYSGKSSSSNLLLCQYYRQMREKFLSRQWNMLAGEIDYDFINDIDNIYCEHSEIDTLYKLNETGFFCEPVSGEQIELTHFFASLNLMAKMRQSTTLSENSPDKIIISDMAGWLGDCLELAADIIASCNDQLTDEEISAITSEMLGSPEGSFSRDNMLADIDAYNIVCYLSPKKENIVKCMHDYYLELMSGTSRFELFVQNRFGNIATYDTMTNYDAANGDLTNNDIANEAYYMLSSSDNIYIPMLRKSLRIDTTNAYHMRVLKIVSETFASYITTEH